MDKIFVRRDFVLGGLSEIEYKKKCITSQERVLIVSFFDIFCSNRFFVWNYNEDDIIIHTGWFSSPIKKGFTKVSIFNNGKGEIVNPDKSVIAIKDSLIEYYSRYNSDITPAINTKEGYKRENEFKDKQLIFYIVERSKFLSLYFYSSLVILLLLVIKKYRIELANIFYVLMGFLFRDMFIWGGMLFHINPLSSSPQPILVKIFLVILFIFVIKKIFKGIKEMKSLNFFEVCIVVFFILVPFLLYF